MAKETTPPAVSRRQFFRGAAGGISGSFVVGAIGGAAAGAGGMHLYDRPHFLIGCESFAQQGEDLALWSTLSALGIAQPSYLDIGANDPVIFNNTYLLYQNGCRGVLVEPNPRHWDRLASVRPEDVLVRAGIGVKAADHVDFYVMGGGPSGHLLSTFSKETAESYCRDTEGKLHIAEVIQIPLLNINDVIAEHFQGAPDLVHRHRGAGPGHTPSNRLQSLPARRFLRGNGRVSLIEMEQGHRRLPGSERICRPRGKFDQYDLH